MTAYSRANWGARPPKSTPVTLDRTKVKGVALHWPDITKPLRGVAAIKSALRGWQDFHMDDRGWADIAYQLAFDQDGNVYELRGITTQSAANGDADVNHYYGAFLLILAPGEKPSSAMMRAVRESIGNHRALFPNSRLVVGHQDVRPEPTECPGEIVEGLIKAGAFEPEPVHRTPNITAFREAKTRKARAAAARKVLEGTGSAEAKSEAKAWLAASAELDARAKALIALEAK